MNTDLQLWLTLNRAPGIGSSSISQLLQRFGSIQQLFANLGALKDSDVPNEAIRFLDRRSEDDIAGDLEWLSQDGHHLLIPTDPRWPDQLESLARPPVLLFVDGDADYLARPQLAIVGSRNPTSAGQRTAKDFARHLSDSGITITSGLALGIDGAAHQGAIEGLAGSVAVVAQGLDTVYPRQHTQLAQQLRTNGALVSEMPVGTEPHAGLFPRRNRLISGLSIGTLVVEAAVRSGSLITARYALEQGREVFAIPGSIHNPLARGCHQLIRQGAKLVETANDIIEEVAGLISTEKPQHAVAPSDEIPNMGLDPDYQKLLKCLQFEPVAIDELVQRSGFSAAEIASMLLILELEGNVICDAGRYSRTC